MVVRPCKAETPGNAPSAKNRMNVTVGNPELLEGSNALTLCKLEEPIRQASKCRSKRQEGQHTVRKADSLANLAAAESKVDTAVRQQDDLRSYDVQ